MPDRDYVFIGEVAGLVGALQSPRFEREAWGLEVEVREAIQLPGAAGPRFEVVPLMDCNMGGHSRAQIEQWFPVGLPVLVVAEEARVFSAPTGTPRLERESDGYGFVMSNRWGEREITNAAVVFDYREYAENAGLRERAPRLADFELFKDRVRLKQASNDAEKLAVLARLVHYPCCVNYFQFEALVKAHLTNPELAADLVRQRRDIEAAYHQGFRRQ